MSGVNSLQTMKWVEQMKFDYAIRQFHEYKIINKNEKINNENKNAKNIVINIITQLLNICKKKQEKDKEELRKQAQRFLMILDKDRDRIIFETIFTRLNNKESFEWLLKYCLDKDINIDYENIIIETICISDTDFVNSISNILKKNNMRLDFKKNGTLYLKKSINSNRIEIITKMYNDIVEDDALENIINSKENIKNIISSILDVDSLDILKWFEIKMKENGIDIYNDIISSDEFINELISDCGHKTLNHLLNIYKGKFDIHHKNDITFRKMCEKGDIDAMKILYEYSEDIDSKIDVTTCNNYAFVKACNLGYLNIVKWLRSKGGGIPHNDNDHETFKTTLKNGNIELCKYLSEEYPVYMLYRNDTGIPIHRNGRDIQNREYYFVINNIGKCTMFIKNNEFDLLEKYFSKSMVEMEISENTSFDDLPSCCICCDDDQKYLINVGCNYLDHLYCGECLTASHKHSNSKKCIICNHQYDESEIKLVKIVTKD